jgi:DNA-binding transcriptional LysR family regulator
VRAAADGEAGHLAVAYTSTSLDPILSRTLRLFRQRFPLVELEIRDQSTYQQVEALLERKIDLGYAVIRLPEFEKDLVFECVRRTAVWVALPPGHPLTKRRRLALRDLGGENFLQLRQVPAAFREWMLNIFRPAGFTPRIIQQAEDVHSLFGLVSAGVGIAIVPEITRRLTPVEVEFRPLPATTPKFEFHIFWRRDNNSPILQNFLKLFREQLGSATARRLR